MISRTSWAILGLGVALAACTPPEPPREPHGKGPHGEGHHDKGHHGEGHHDKGHHGEEQHGKHKHEFTGGMKAFHDVLAPVYHMEKSPARGDKSCEAVGAMKTAAGQIAGEPKGDPALWKSRAEALGASVEALGEACKASGRPAVEGKLEVVHDAFHALMKAEQGK
ncbi:MAG: hypothetical protein MUF64_21770 [Polyangiaceae bacterium]|jgi:hypothetical protein|nr:hypothetical protein [Polyangiaceae bacterium]